MATVTKVRRQRKDGTFSEGWKVRWLEGAKPDGSQNRRSRSFKTKKAADSFCAKVAFRLDTGQTVDAPDVRLVGDAIGAFVDYFETLVKAGKREWSSYDSYEQHLRLHIRPDPVAAIDIKKLTAPDCNDFGERMVLKLSPQMAEKVFNTFKVALKREVAKGVIPVNPAAEIKLELGNRKLLSDEEADAQTRAVIPALFEVRAIWQAAEQMAAEIETGDGGRARAIMAILTFAGLRISELRGAGIQHVVLFGAPKIKVRRRADRKGNLGPPKSQAGYRDIPLGPMAVDAIRAWLDAMVRKSHLGGHNKERLLFPTEGGKPYTYEHLYRHVLIPVMLRASKILSTQSLVTYGPKPDNDGRPTVRNMGHFAGPYCPLVVRPKYSFHELRHVFASLQIDGGAKPKTIQTLMGHSSINVTMDVYGHLWSDTHDDQAAARAVEMRVMNARKDSA